MKYWFTSDEHYGHKKIIKYCDRPFSSIEEMDYVIMENFNSVVGENDITIHAGDFTLWKDVRGIHEKYINKLNGKHIFLKGSHDYWLPWKGSQQRWERKIGKTYIVVDHYAMTRWARSHYNSFHLYGHSHGKLQTIGKTWDCGVDNNNLYPISFDQVRIIMRDRPDNENLIKRN